MADSKAKGPEEAASEAEDAEERKIEDRQNEFSGALVGDSPDSPGVPTNQNTAEITRLQSARLGTDPDLALGDLAHAKRARSLAAEVLPTPPLKIRVSVNSSRRLGSVAVTTVGHAPAVGAASSSPGQAFVRPGPKPAPPKPTVSLFASCFGGSAIPASPLSPSGKLPSLQVAPRKQTVSTPTRRRTVDSARPVVPSVQAETKALVLDSIANNNPIAVAAETSVQSAIPRSPSCRCSIQVIEAENAAKTEESLSLELGAPAGDSASMSKAENDPGISSGQQILNAEAEQLIAAVKRADEESQQPPPESRPFDTEGRQSATGLSPIRGLRPSFREVRSPGRRQLRTDFADGNSSARIRKSPYQGRSRAPHNYDYEPRATARGVLRLFDSIIGRGDVQRQEQAFSQSPRRFHRKPKRKNLRAVTNSPTWAEQKLRERETEDDRQGGSPRGDPAQNNPQEKSSGRDQAYSGPANLREDLSDLPGTSMIRDQENLLTGESHPDQIGNIDFHLTQQLRDAKLEASDIRWKTKDPYRESSQKKQDPRRRGHPDPSFNPRPGDIIIRARKRAGLRLTDFYYYDNENYMEPGDQILRAKFDYLPPMDKMYLWCRLYVYNANNTYTFLDSTSESVEKFGTENSSGKLFIGN